MSSNSTELNSLVSRIQKLENKLKTFYWKCKCGKENCKDEICPCGKWYCDYCKKVFGKKENYCDCEDESEEEEDESEEEEDESEEEEDESEDESEEEEDEDETWECICGKINSIDNQVCTKKSCRKWVCYSCLCINAKSRKYCYNECE